MGDMDSGNSGSLQSSSGGDEDYHESSRGGAAADSFSSFFNHQSYPPTTHVTSFNPPPPPPSFFDPLASYLDHLSRSTNLNPVLNPADPVWPKDTLIASGPAGFENPQPSSSNAAADRQPNQIPSGRNPRKRTRASRRAPTTVLTTDTTNFRAMVQEFTGIPAPPFGSGGGACSSSLFFPRSRLDLFGGGMNAPANSTSLPPYLLRPLAHKISPPPLVSTVTTTIKNHNSDFIPASSSGGQYQIPSSDLGLLTNLSFASSSLLPKYPSSDNPYPGSSKPGSGGSLELPITTARNDVNVQEQLGGITAGFLNPADAVNSSSGKNNGGPLGWAEVLGLGADAGAGAPAPAPSSNGSVNNGAPYHSHHRPQNLGFAHQ